MKYLLATDGFIYLIKRKPIEIAEFGQGASVEYGKIRVALERAGRPIGPMDMLIAAHALDLAVPLVTNKAREVSRVPGLRT